MSAPVSQAASSAPPAKSIVSPTMDLWCVGLGSIVALAPFVLFGNTWIVSFGLSATGILALWINMPHFMASYRIVYRSKEAILRHKAASIFVPVILLGYCAFALARAEQDFRFIEILLMVSSGYLAWHYTGQIWGMMATYAVLGGKPFSSGERTLIRAGLRVQLVWHVSWVLQMVPSDYATLTRFAGQAYFVMSMLTVAAYALALGGFFLYRRRTGSLPPLRAAIAWFALCFWYAALARDRETIHLVQIAHAVQYLSFPARVEANVYRREHPEDRRSLWLHMWLYFGALIGGGFFLKWLFATPGVIIAHDLWGGTAALQVPTVMLAFINIHHYFTDGCVWKISSPTVREDLFSHLPRKEKG